MTQKVMRAGQIQRIRTHLLAILNVLVLNVTMEGALAPTARKRDAQAPVVTTAFVSMIHARRLVALVMTAALAGLVTVTIAKQ